jgi:hypothetical protein
VLPFLRDELSKSRFGPVLYRGRGASLLALVKIPAGPELLETELRRICNIGLEKFLHQKRRASILPIAVGGKLFSAPNLESLQQVSAFVDQQRAGEPTAPRLGAARGTEHALAPPKA